ncbi:MAG: ribbon-helix-helix protein, CopG family [Chloroflexi bacterium]|nr:ribbon-helix-helix protein, CopG family [Chloroflexota bacterium]
MKRTQIQLDEPTYERLRRRAFEQGRSMSAVARDILAGRLSMDRHGRVGR